MEFNVVTILTMLAIFFHVVLCVGLSMSFDTGRWDCNPHDYASESCREIKAIDYLIAAIDVPAVILVTLCCIMWWRRVKGQDLQTLSLLEFNYPSISLLLHSIVVCIVGVVGFELPVVYPDLALGDASAEAVGGGGVLVFCSLLAGLMSERYRREIVRRNLRYARLVN